MASSVAIKGTTSSHGGYMMSAGGSHWRTPEGNVCLQGDAHYCPIPGHGVTPIVGGCTTHAQDQGRQIAIEGSVAGCGATLTGNFATHLTLT